MSFGTARTEGVELIRVSHCPQLRGDKLVIASGIDSQVVTFGQDWVAKHYTNPMLKGPTGLGILELYKLVTNAFSEKRWTGYLGSGMMFTIRVNPIESVHFDVTNQCYVGVSKYVRGIHIHKQPLRQIPDGNIREV